MKNLAAFIALCLFAACGSNPPSGPAPAEESVVAADVMSLEAEDIDGQSIRLGALVEAGRPAALIFWQTWCGPCLKEAPALAAAARRFGNHFEFVGVVPGTDEFVDEAEIRRIAARFELPYPQVRDRELAWSKAFRVEGTPTIVVIAPDGSVLYRGHRSPEDWASLAKP